MSKLTQIFSHRYQIEERLVRHFERGKQRSWSLALPDNQLERGGFTYVRRHVRLPRDLLECGQVVVEVTVDALSVNRVQIAAP